MSNIKKNSNKKLYKYDVAFSFAGEQRKYIKKVYEYVQSKGINIFYDEAQALDMWGANLIEYFHNIFKNNARFCVMFISKEYAKKVWPNFERKIIQARSLIDNDYILPVRFDNVEIKGMLNTTGYITIGKKTPQDLGEIILNKVKSKIDSNGQKPHQLIHWIDGDSFYNNNIFSNSKKIQQEGENNALQIFHEAAIRIPAYKDFLKRNKINPAKIKTISEFQQIPSTDLNNYIRAYDMKDKIWDGNLDWMHTISASHSNSGEFTLWPRNLNNEIEGAYVFELILRNFYEIRKKKTLFINCFPMGFWVGGSFTAACINLITLKNYPLTFINAGSSKDDVCGLLKRLSFYFDQIVISVSATLLRDLLNKAVDVGIDWKRINVKFLCHYEDMSEPFRMYVLKMLGKTNLYDTIINIYGFSEAALMAFETPISIYLNKVLLVENKKILPIHNPPNFYNFDPRLVYFNEHNGSLLITKRSGMPLIQYCTNDLGEVITYEKAMSIMEKTKSKILPKTKLLQLKKQSYKLPFIILYHQKD